MLFTGSEFGGREENSCCPTEVVGVICTEHHCVSKAVTGNGMEENLENVEPRIEFFMLMTTFLQDGRNRFYKG